MHKPPLSRVLSLVTHVMLAAMLAFGLGIVSAHEAYADGETVLVAGSDFQASTNEESAANVTDLLTAIKTYGGYAQVDGMLFGGDYTNAYGVTKEQSEVGMAALREAATGVYPELNSSNMILIQGNHDAMTDEISSSGLHEFDDYLVYVLNTQNDFPWKQGKTAGALSKVKASSEALGACLTELADRGETRPVIIAGHVPLHFTARTSSRHTTGDNMYSSLVFDVVNEAGKDLDIIYLFGHNHSKGWDCYMGGSSVMRKAGDTVLIPELNETSVTTDKYTEETLTFTYMNAGYTGYYMNCGPEELDAGEKELYSAADETLTGTVFEIYSDRIVITRYDTEGVHELGHAGEADPYKGGIDTGLIPEESYSKSTESPQEVTF